MKLKMRTTATLLIAISMMILVIPVMAKPPTFDVDYYQTQFQWRAGGSNCVQWGTWSYGPGGPGSTIVGAETSVMRLTGDALHSSFVYSPLVDPYGKTRGMSHVYIDDGTGHWTLHEGKTSYRYDPIYGPYRVVNYFRGYMEFNGAPSTANFLHGVLYQWAYVMKPETEPVDEQITYAIFCPVMKAWLVGFSVYIQDPLAPSTPYNIPFPVTTWPQPVPANNDNPLGL